MLLPSSGWLALGRGNLVPLLTSSRPLKQLPSKPLPIDEDSTLHLACFYLQQPDLVHHLAPFLLLLSLSYPPSYWPIWSLPLLILPAYCHIPTTINFTLKMEPAYPSEKLVSYHNATQYHNLEDHNMNLHHCENLKSSIKHWNIDT